jgi:hypothetical protein
VWGSGLQRGAVIRPPKTDAHRFIVLRSAAEPKGVWRAESVDIAADYRRIFGEAPPRWPLAFLFAGIAAAGVLAGAALAKRLPVARLRQGFAVMVIATGAFVLWQNGVG